MTHYWLGLGWAGVYVSLSKTIKVHIDSPILDCFKKLSQGDGPGLQLLQELSSPFCCTAGVCSLHLKNKNMTSL